MEAAMRVAASAFGDDHKDEDLPTLEEVAERCIRNSDSCAEPIETKGGILYIHEK